MRKIDLEAFFELIKRFNSSPSDEKEKEIIKHYIENLSPEDSELMSSESAAEYSDEDNWRMLYLNTDLIAFLAINSPDFDNMYFRGEHKIINYTEFYNISYLVRYANIYPSQYHDELLFAMAEELEGISLERLIQQAINEGDEEEIGDGDEMSLCEWSFYDMLEEMSQKEVSQIIEILKVNRKTKRILVKYVIEKNTTKFVDTITLLSPAKYETAALVAKVWYYIRMLASFLSNQDIQPSDRIHFILENKYILLNEADTKMNYAILEGIDMEETEDDASLPNLDYHYMYQSVMRFFFACIYLHHNFLELKINIDAVERVQKFISLCEHTKKIEASILKEEIDIRTYTGETVEILELFKDKFITELVIPENIKRKKSKNEYFCYVAKGGKMNEERCRRLYRALVDKSLLKWDEETYFSFMYRMCPDYAPQRDDPSSISWQGQSRELFSLIWEYYEGTTKIWEKTKNFFHDINGIPPKINGAKNQATSPSTRMQGIFNSLK